MKDKFTKNEMFKFLQKNLENVNITAFCKKYSFNRPIIANLKIGKLKKEYPFVFEKLSEIFGYTVRQESFYVIKKINEHKINSPVYGKRENTKNKKRKNHRPGKNS